MGTLKEEELMRKVNSTIAGEQSRKGWLGQLGAFGSAITVGLCPVCIPAVAAFLSSIGLGFLVSESVLKPLLWVFLALAMFGFVWSYLKEHRDWRPLALAAFTGLALYLGRYVYFGGVINMTLMYGGMIGIVAASLWNLLLRRQKSCCIREENRCE